MTENRKAAYINGNALPISYEINGSERKTGAWGPADKMRFCDSSKNIFNRGETPANSSRPIPKKGIKNLGKFFVVKFLQFFFRLWTRFYVL